MWLKANKLTIHTKKTHYMMFHRTRIKHNTNIKILINNNIVDHINNTKFLGTIIDSKLNWAANILYIDLSQIIYIHVLYNGCLGFVSLSFLIIFFTAYIMPLFSTILYILFVDINKSHSPKTKQN